MQNLKFNIQRFSEGEPGIHVLGGEPNPEPMPAPTQRHGAMPSSIAPEAWQNVEEMMVTLSNNIRVKMAAFDETMKDGFKNIDEKLGNLNGLLLQTITAMKELNETINLVAVEVDAIDDDDDESHSSSSKSTGWTGRK